MHLRSLETIFEREMNINIIHETTEACGMPTEFPQYYYYRSHKLAQDYSSFIKN